MQVKGTQGVGVTQPRLTTYGLQTQRKGSRRVLSCLSLHHENGDNSP